MGRKIPGKKHRKVKDPDSQKKNRFDKIKDKINNPPSKVDSQETPKSLLRIMALKEKVKNFKPKKEKKLKKNVFDMKRALGNEIRQAGMDRPNRHALPLLTQGPNENVYLFGKRIDRMCNAVLNEVEFESKYGVEVTRNAVGEVVDVKKVKAVKRSKKPKLSQKRKDKLKKKEENDLLGQVKEFPGREEVGFGEVAHAPPTNLRLPKAVEKNKNAPRPGQKNLLLKNILSENAALKKQRKKLTQIEKQRQEERRKSVVEAFRKSKKDKSSFSTGII